MPGPAGMMNIAGQGIQGYPGQMPSMGQQPAMVSYMYKLLFLFKCVHKM